MKRIGPKRRRDIKRLFCSMLFCVGLTECAMAAEYFVGKSGNDANDGLSRATAFLTVQKGMDALAPGDTLTIGSGEYFGKVKRADLGSAEKETIIRAEIPGTVLLRGDVRAPAFEKTDGYRYVYAARFDQAPQSVNEVDTLTVFRLAPNRGELDFRPGSYHYDEAGKTLYLSTSDLRDPKNHYYTVPVIPDNGLRLDRPRRVVIEGLAFTGFNANRHFGWSGHQHGVVWGLHLSEPERCVVRECAA